MAEIARRRRSRRGEGGQLRDELLMAAWAVLDETGSDEAVTARNVAERAGVAVSALYLHFASLDELKYELAYRISLDRMASAMRKVATASARDRPATDRDHQQRQ